MKFPRVNSSLLLALALLTATGCPSGSPNSPPSASPEPGPQRTLQVVVIDDEPLAEAIERQWQARSETPLALRRVTSAEMRDGGDMAWAIDVVVFPSGLLGEFAEQERIVPLGKRQLESEDFDRQDVFELLRRGETSWGKESYAVSLGSPQLTLMYRRDVFAALDLTPPTTWDAYQRLVEQLGQRDVLGETAPAAEQAWYATREPLGQGWAGQLLLARAAPYVRHPNQYSTLFDLRDMRPLIAGAPFVQALEELVAAAGASGQDDAAATPREARGDLLAGRSAMALSWPSQADPVEAAASGPLEIGFAPLPGSPNVFNFRNQAWEPRAAGDPTTVPLLASAGRLVALTRGGRRSAAANTMLLWLGGSELGSRVAPTSLSTTLFRTSQISSSRRWVNSPLDDQAARAYGELVRQTQNQSVWLTSVRIPARHRYLAVLDSAVQQALAGEPAQAALDEAASQWQQITDELGRDAQQTAYTRSIGLEP